jgi:hypothetical protein
MRYDHSVVSGYVTPPFLICNLTKKLFMNNFQALFVNSEYKFARATCELFMNKAQVPQPFGHCLQVRVRLAVRDLCDDGENDMLMSIRPNCFLSRRSDAWHEGATARTQHPGISSLSVLDLKPILQLAPRRKF